MTDLCWTCQQLYRDIASSSNLPEPVKAAKLKKLQGHLDLAQEERSVYQQMVEASRSVCNTPLGPHSPCSNPNPGHYSFDFAQQVHLPHDPMQPGPLYFMCPRKVGIFGVCCEGIPQQVNFLIDESHCTSKGSISVISYLHYFFEHYGSGECEVDLHCDNCCGQNKNNFVLAYFMWRVLMGLHRRVSVHFLIAGHTKFSPDWCFGLLKQRFRRTAVSSLEDLAACVEKSTRTRVNVAQLTGLENGPPIVPIYDWQAFLSPMFKPLQGIKSHHHFTFSSDNPGTVVYKEFWRSDEKQHMMLKIPVVQVPLELPTPCPSPGLPLQRQWYLWDVIRDFCPVTCRDILCPQPKQPKPKSGVAAVDDVPPASEPAAAKSAMSARSRGVSRGRSREVVVSVTHEATPTVETTAATTITSARGRGRGRLNRETAPTVETTAEASTISHQSHGHGVVISVTHEATPTVETTAATTVTSARGRGHGRGRLNRETAPTLKTTAEASTISHQSHDHGVVISVTHETTPMVEITAAATVTSSRGHARGTGRIV